MPDAMGATPRRREDQRFLTGQGRYLDDLSFPSLAHAVFVRSPHAHARIAGIDTAAARAMPGVLAVLTGTDSVADGLQPLRPTVDANTHTNEPFRVIPQPVLASDRVRYVGEPIAIVVADTKTQALDAAEHVAIAYDMLQTVTDARAALAPDAPQLASEIPNNCCHDWLTGEHAAAEAALTLAAHIVRLDLHNHRIVTNPMEPRGCVGQYDVATGRYTLTVSSQSIHVNRDRAAMILGVPPTQVRFIAPDVGGGFGAKNFPYLEQALLLWAAKRANRTVKWIATRSEVFLTDHQARDHHAHAELALDGDGKFLALRIDSAANLGAYMVGGAGAVQTYQYVHLQGTVYHIPAIALRVRSVITNTTPIGVTRGPGFGEAGNIIERLIDAAARRCGFDAADLRRKNFRPTPFTNNFGYNVDSGDFHACLDGALAKADMASFSARRAASESQGKLRGLGFAYHIKGTGGLPSENVDIRFEEDGTVSLITGTQTIGQGHETTFPQILAHKLGVPNHLIRLVQGDTDAIPMGGGHGSSRATYMGGTAIFRASDIIIEKAKPIAAELLEAAEADVSFSNGAYRVTGTDRTVALLAVAAHAREAGNKLDTYHHWTREEMTFPNGAHVVEVEIDRNTGLTRLVRHTAVDDYGVLVNPLIAAGQAHGAIAQGAGQALMEQAVYHPETAQPITGSFMDYALPRADDMPSFNLSFHGTPCTTNPLGVKGAGEAGAVAMLPAIHNAILDALAPLGVTHFDGPATPFRVWQAMATAGQPRRPDTA